MPTSYIHIGYDGLGEEFNSILEAVEHRSASSGGRIFKAELIPDTTIMRIKDILDQHRVNAVNDIEALMAEEE